MTAVTDVPSTRDFECRFQCCSILYSSYMAVLLENDMFTFWFWILVIGRYAIMFSFGTRFLALTVYGVYFCTITGNNDDYNIN